MDTSNLPAVDPTDAPEPGRYLRRATGAHTAACVSATCQGECVDPTDASPAAKAPTPISPGVRWLALVLAVLALALSFGVQWAAIVAGLLALALVIGTWSLPGKVPTVAALIIAVAALGLALSNIVGGIGSGTTPTVQGPSVSASPIPAPSVPIVPASPVNVPPSVPAASAPVGSADTIAFVDGTYLVGTDIVAGTYHTDGPAIDPSCSWSISSHNSAVIHGPADITVKAGETVKTHGCQVWTLR